MNNNNECSSKKHTFKHTFKNTLVETPSQLDAKPCALEKKLSAPEKINSMTANLIIPSPASKRDLKPSALKVTSLLSSYSKVTSNFVAFTLASNAEPCTLFQPKRRPCSAPACTKTCPPIKSLYLGFLQLKYALLEKGRIILLQDALYLSHFI